jgi:glycerol uptake facilitator-like aquaporin
MMAGMKTARVAGLATTAVLLAASPAGATTVLANQKYAWFYWVAPILAVSAVAMIIALWGGYIRKVLFPKYRGRKVEE